MLQPTPADSSAFEVDGERVEEWWPPADTAAFRAGALTGFCSLRTRFHGCLTVAGDPADTLVVALREQLQPRQFLFPGGTLAPCCAPPADSPPLTVADLFSDGGGASASASAGAGAGAAAGGGGSSSASASTASRARGKGGKRKGGGGGGGGAGGKRKGGGGGGAATSRPLPSVADADACTTLGAVIVPDDAGHGDGNVALVPILRTHGSAAAAGVTISAATDLTVRLRLDTVVVCSADTPVSQAAVLLQSALLRAAQSAAPAVHALRSSPSVSVSCVPIAAPVGALPHCVCPTYVLVGDTEDSDSLVAQRMALHHAFGLPTDRPVLRLGAGMPWADPAAAAAAAAAEDDGFAVLRNVHEGLPGPKVPGAELHLVRGPYEYYHYMQQRFNDKGWGCAYRSLQTLASWFRLNRYTGKPTPTHTDIQTALVEVGDKPAAFVGSRQWIGSQEVGFALDQLLGVACKFQFVAQGSQLAQHGRTFAHHFDTQGTPIMMGGGNLAFTMLGVAYNASTGDAAFLILDPHYTGRDELKAIQSKAVAMEGYRACPVQWKTVDDFSATDFYGICMPQRPSVGV